MMLKLIILVFSLLGLFSACKGQFEQDGQCDPNVQLDTTFNLTNFLGTWHEIYRSDNPNQNGDCATYELTRSGDNINVRYSSVANNFGDVATGTASVEEGTPKLSLSLSSSPNPIDFWVRLTDHSTFALTFSCENISGTRRRVHVWVLSRENRIILPLTPILINTTLQSLFDIAIDDLDLINHSENSCYELPIIEPNQPIVLPGTCDQNMPVVQNFDVPRFTGVWHQIASYHSENARGSCNRAEYTLGDGVVNVQNSEVWDQALFTVSGQATVNSTDNSAKLSVILNVGGSNVAQDLWVLATDYTSYAISYTCVQESATQKRVYSWILSRSRRMPAASQVAVDQVVNSIIDLNYKYYAQTDQSDASCFYFPTPAPNTPVLFRGQCESVNVQAMSNFSVETYMGRWHTIELYPASSQTGTCSNAVYDLVDGKVNVRNSHVIGQQLSSVNAVAELVSTDGSAKLQVTFPGSGTNPPVSSMYWVLNTDYTNYAFVYSCTNINDDVMRVGSWKLSRTKSLTPASVTAINNVINTVQVLDARYYETMPQTVEACFYFPQPEVGVPVEFPGQCEENINVMQSFDFQRFSGEWFEIQAYPKLEQPGHCISHVFTAAGNTRFTVASMSVEDQFRTPASGVITRNSTATDGRLTLTIPNENGADTVIPFWILNTDYTDYALAYSCVNVNADYRKIWSWKLSKTKQLSSAANTAINNLISPIVVLDDRYYQDVDQSERACSYLPDLSPGDTIILPGQCDTTIRGIANFNLSRYAGRWRLIESYRTNAQSGTCNIAEYTLVDSATINILNSQVVNQDLRTISGTARVSSTDGTGSLLVNLNNRTFNFIVLDTDYTSYALGYGCVNRNENERRIYSWKLSRENTLSQAAINNINQVINSIEVLHNRFYYTVDRSEAGCFYFPSVDTTQAVTYRGQCDESIPVVANFDVERYLGLWHDIESYPTTRQSGTCLNAEYTLGANGVDVLNTQVINQGLTSIRGNAVLDSTDGSAKLKVTFNEGVSTNYWVLATDYSSFSLVYSCTNINSEYKTVFSWKLSRTKSLTPAAVTAINNAMSPILVLDQRYFVTRDQTPAGCFYFPEPQPGVSVVFPGQCDDSIAAMPSFNLQQFAGVWHEIQTYPDESLTGQCVNRDFILSGNSYNLQSSYVAGVTLSLSNARVETTNVSGKLNIIGSTSSNPNIQIPYWILSTDYTNYALAYSCRNLNSDYRGVWSWKLSRTQTLSAASNNAINAALENVNVLRNEYYEDVDQSEEACFHLPTLNPGEPVILPGQCDTTINGVPDFEISRYAGRWRLIESYGSNFQTGTCNIAEYTLGSSDTLAVVNSQVVDQELRTIAGTARVSSTDRSGKLLFYYPSRNESMEITILATDYVSYSLAYSCVNLDNNQRRVYSWKMSRNNTLSQAAVNNINQVMSTVNVLHQPYYYTVNRNEAACFYFPSADSSQAVRFRGQCNENIPVVANFDVERYLGLWHDIESYPTTSQSGTCYNAKYTLGANGVDVLNTQVINQALASIRGNAVVASTDGSAKLNVTFNVGGSDVSTDYWVIATDYISYSLVYSCSNIDSEYMNVFSWKLSRTKSLTPAAVTVINNAMSPILVLDQRYFVTRDQTPAGCFYFPEPQPGVPVVFPGQCDESIAAMPSFNLQQFAGVWHEIQTYPDESLTGQCVNRDFILSGNSYNLQSSYVAGVTLSLSNARVETTNESGKLNIIGSTSSNPNTRIPYWILSTDYSNYALAYSCRNLNSDYREVRSWKLSRNQTLSAASNNAINAALENVNVLRNEYYEDVDQSEEACFHLPTLNPGEPVILPGQCDTTIGGVPNFEISRYVGRWRLIESYGSDFQTGTCNVARYTLDSNGTLGVVNSQVVNEQLTSITGSARISSLDGSGKLLFYFPSRDESIEITILATDYLSYSLGYSCVNLENNQRRIYSWKMSRDNTLSQAAVNNINQVMSTVNVLHQPYYYTVNRNDTACFYYPPVDSSQIVRFRGQCDENIPVVANFDVARYLNQWHDIESYPMPFQDGTCPNALYTLGTGGVVDVFNTQVIDQTLDTINGIATVASTDGSAKLKVSFNIGGIDVSTNYWVLSTDYTSYAFVYSCTNVDDEFMNVVSWKLSRSKALAPAAQVAINNIINNYKFLDQRYYVVRDQSPEGCFYFPVPQPGKPVEFPGVCDSTIQAVPNFNFNQFQGTWFEIEAYPKEVQPGQCISHDFAVSSPNSFLLSSYNVVNQRQTITTGQVTFDTTDGSGRLKIEIVANGETITIPYWVLSTDYTSYALVYSCLNIREDFRGVWSWKLSRTKELTPAANVIINNAISDVVVLDNRYYENIQQTANACFFLPVLGPTDPVIFPGQCDPNVPVLQGFDAARYLGHWRLIETYYTNFQDGTCNSATYSPGPDGSVIVYNTQVVNEELDTITGSAVVATTDGSAKLSVTFPNAGEPTDYWILDTDYSSFALVYTCVNLDNDRRRVWSWKMSRTNSLTPAAANRIDEIVNSINVLNDEYYQAVDRTDAGCFYFPTPNPEISVLFPGQCDQNISVVTGFNAERYQGQWYDLESYPTRFQSGTCNSARYTLNPDNTLDVLNTQVVGQVLQSRPGTARPSSNDGSAKFDVTFLINGEEVTINYWVLATDYDNYALVYSCRNVDEESREVFTWKLSKQKTLSAAAVTAINNTMASVQVLDQRYFVQRSHSEEACFFYPDNNGGDVILDGQCVADANVLAVQNFQPESFNGLWHEVSRFPSALQDGECTATDYTLAGANSFNIVQTIVNNETQSFNTVQGTMATDGRGVIRISSNEIPFEDLYVLATDYTEYALLYGCRNLQDNKKQVYSWKLSRSREGLSAGANVVIDTVVSNNIDLFENYYRPTAQDNNACFYYPDFDVLPPFIELPGPCDETIRGIPNFRAAEYLGRWFEIARYPQTAQSGQCNRAVYSADGASVRVVNSQVVDGPRLATITGSATASSDGSGLLNVTFVVGQENRTSNYYVLATDYSSYALVYSCANLNNGNRKVGSWKLSRTTAMSAQANTAINAVIEKTQGLRENYYQSTSQSDEACFYVPEFVPFRAPVFRGQCEDINGITGFEANRFIGWWHEIESYPVDGYRGECVSSNYEQSGNAITVVDTIVSNNTGEVDSATVTISNNGRIRRVSSSGAVQDTWVLSTDYETYALLYSCENVDDEYRRVWSAKHSKARSLTQAAQDTMASVIEANNLLYPQFYVSVNQENSACFHYPEQTGAQVILPGQCDDNIPVVPNFNMADFAGTWYQISRYDAVQGSSCAGIRFVFNGETGVIDFIDYDVVDGNLLTREGTGRVDGASLTLTWGNATESKTILILDTDITNYALAYSCVNIDQFRRQVSAWQLSRGRTLNNESSSAIDVIIGRREELYTDYFKSISQSAECAEPSSAFLFKSSIIVILVCTLLQLAF